MLQNYLLIIHGFNMVSLTWKIIKDFYVQEDFFTYVIFLDIIKKYRRPYLASFSKMTFTSTNHI